MLMFLDLKGQCTPLLKTFYFLVPLTIVKTRWYFKSPKKNLHLKHSKAMSLCRNQTISLYLIFLTNNSKQRKLYK